MGYYNQSKYCPCPRLSPRKDWHDHSKLLLSGSLLTNKSRARITELREKTMTSWLSVGRIAMTEDKRRNGQLLQQRKTETNERCMSEIIRDMNQAEQSVHPHKVISVHTPYKGTEYKGGARLDARSETKQIIESSKSHLQHEPSYGVGR